MKLLMKCAILMMAMVAMPFLVSCSDDDEKIENLPEKMLGSWIHCSTDGVYTPTNRKSVHTFVKEGNSLKMYNSIAVVGDNDPWWVYKKEMDVTIDGNHVVMKATYGDGKQVVTEMDMIRITSSEMEYQTVTHITMPDGEKIEIGSRRELFTRQTKDYRNDILGTWEGHIQEGQSTYDDNLKHRWEFKADGTYVYYCEDNGVWHVSSNTQNDYFIDGTLICTRWADPTNYPGQELREWWEIGSIENGVMTWNALRQNDDGTTQTVVFEMTKVE